MVPAGSTHSSWPGHDEAEGRRPSRSAGRRDMGDRSALFKLAKRLSATTLSNEFPGVQRSVVARVARGLGTRSTDVLQTAV